MFPLNLFRFSCLKSDGRGNRRVPRAAVDGRSTRRYELPQEAS